MAKTKGSTRCGLLPRLLAPENYNKLVERHAPQNQSDQKESKEEFMRNNPNLQAMPIKPIPKKYDVSKFSELTEIEGRKIDTHCSICFESYEPDNLLITTVCVH